jgi:hypothetical protein
MEEVLKGENGAVAVFLFLLPGFLGMSVYDFLIEGEPRDNVQRIIFSFVLTLLSAIVVNMTLAVPLIPMAVPKDADSLSVLKVLVGVNLLYMSCSSVLIAISLAVLNNYGLPLRLFRSIKVTYKTSAVDVWQDIFYTFRRYWIRITFSDGRELVGWPMYFSAVGKPRELFIADATWLLTNEDGVSVSVDVSGPGVYIADFTKVTTIALLD